MARLPKLVSLVMFGGCHSAVLKVDWWEVALTMTVWGRSNG